MLGSKAKLFLILSGIFFSFSAYGQNIDDVKQTLARLDLSKIDLDNLRESDFFNHSIAAESRIKNKFEAQLQVVMSTNSIIVGAEVLDKQKSVPAIYLRNNNVQTFAPEAARATGMVPKQANVDAVFKDVKAPTTISALSQPAKIKRLSQISIEFSKASQNRKKQIDALFGKQPGDARILDFESSILFDGQIAIIEPKTKIVDSKDLILIEQRLAMPNHKDLSDDIHMIRFDRPLSSVLPKFQGIPLTNSVLGSESRTIQPNDPAYRRNLQLNFRKAGFEEVWFELSKNNAFQQNLKKLKIGVIDSKVDDQNPDLVGRVEVDDLISTGDPNSRKAENHGTHVAGIIAALGDNNKSGTGAFWKMGIEKVYCAAVLEGRNGSVDDAVKAIHAMRQKGVNIVNMSFGTYERLPQLAAAMRIAAQDGMIFVCSAGNDGIENNHSHYPSDYAQPNPHLGNLHKHVVSVAWLNPNESKNHFSNWGSEAVTIGCIGEKVYSTLPLPEFDTGNSALGGTDSGTSMAAPTITGALGLIWAKEFQSKKDEDTAMKVIMRLKEIARPTTVSNGKSWGGNKNLVLDIRNLANSSDDRTGDTDTSTGDSRSPDVGSIAGVVDIPQFPGSADQRDKEIREQGKKRKELFEQLFGTGSEN